MKRVIQVLLIGLMAMLACVARPAMAAAEGAAGVETPMQHDAGAGAGAHGEHSGTGELIPVSEEGQAGALTQAIWVVIIFMILLAILYPTAWKGVLAALKERESRIRKDIADAEAARAKAEATLAEYNKQLAQAEDRVREMLGKAQVDGERLAATIREKAGGEAEGIKSKALADIEEARKAAVAQIHEQAVELSTAIAEKIIRHNLNAEDQRELVRSSLQQLEAVKRN
jgi:F-type H+-transporting ATPase subunit b